MSIQVEFFGIPRVRTGVGSVEVAVGAETTLATVLATLRDEFPEFARACLDGNQLQTGFLASIDGGCFTRQDVPLVGGESILILSADAGG